MLLNDLDSITNHSSSFSYYVNNKLLKIHRTTLIIDHPIDPFEYLNTTELYPKVFWKQKNSSIIRLGVGAAYTMNEIPYMVISETEFPSFFGGMFFQENALYKKENIWTHTPSTQFFIPRIEITLQEHKLPVLHYHYLDGETIHPSLFDSTTTQLNLFNPSYLHRTNSPSFDEWEILIKKALQDFATTPLQKVVLARASHMVYKDSINPLSALKHLMDQGGVCTFFGYLHSKESAFIGASPEYLYQRAHLTFTTEAVAGTKSRGSSLEEEIHNLHALLHGEKEIREFTYVSRFLKETLSTFCSTYTDNPQMTVIKTAYLQHLYSVFSGTLLPSITDKNLIEMLHPTPAIGGSPRDLALDFITRFEPFFRGYYCAPIGWISPTSAQFSVAIRSAFIHKNQMTLFAGAGIVKGSDPLQEWEELEAKISPYLPSSTCF